MNQETVGGQLQSSRELTSRYRFDDSEHLHFLDERPLTGTSSVMSIVGKPGLVYWAAGEAVKTLGWTNPKFTPHPDRERIAEEYLKRHSHFSTEEYLKELDKAYSAHSKSLNKAAKKGKDLHAELERYVKLCMEKGGQPVNVVEWPEMYSFVDWAIANVDKFLWSEMHTFSETHWLGGISDCGALMKDGKVVIIDFKSSKEAYVNHFLQIGGYAIQLLENGGFTRKGERMIDPMKVDEFIIIPFGAPEFLVEKQSDTTAFETGFKAALNLYRLDLSFKKE